MRCVSRFKLFANDGELAAKRSRLLEWRSRIMGVGSRSGAGALLILALAAGLGRAATRRSADSSRPVTPVSGEAARQVEDSWRPIEEPTERFPDGGYSAEVEYFNPETGYAATYTLDVEVEDGEVTTIYFPNGGWLDGSHIMPTELDEDGSAEVTDDQGREFQVHIES
jgi:hypothetical protein